MTQPQQTPEGKESIEEFIGARFEENFERLKFESGHGISPEVKEQAKLQVLMYWKRLKKIAESITDTEVRLTLPGRKTPRGREFTIEGIVDIVREKGRTVMYDLKTHDPEYIRTNLREYQRQLNVYAYIWQTLRAQELNEMAIIATQFPEGIAAAWRNRGRNPGALDDELDRWDPVIGIGFNGSDVESTISEFADAIDAIEDGSFSPPIPARLQEKAHTKETFASRVCSNCDIRFSCSSYRVYVSGSRSRDLKKFREMYEERPTDAELDARLDAAIADV
jgi:hypothetical protein